MKTKGWLIRGLAGCVGVLSGCGGEVMSKEVTEFDWYAVATAPRDYPMEVVNGTFFYKGQDYGVTIPSGGTLTQNWKVSTSAYVIGPKFKPLPDRVGVTFYSYAENQFYRGEFALPYERILELFQQQLKDSPDNTYAEILLGIAPGGSVAVWLKGPQTKEVFFGQAEKIEMSPEAGFKLPFTSKEQSDGYVERALAESVTTEQLAYIKEKGAPLGTWSRYRNLYKWIPTYKDGKIAIKPEMPVDFLNGEVYWIPTHFSEQYADTPKILPAHLEFRAQVTPEESLFYVVDFEPFELMDAFERLGANDEKVYIEFDPQVPVERMKIRVYNEKESIELKKVHVE